MASPHYVCVYSLCVCVVCVCVCVCVVCVWACFLSVNLLEPNSLLHQTLPGYLLPTVDTFTVPSSGLGMCHASTFSKNPPYQCPLTIHMCVHVCTCINVHVCVHTLRIRVCVCVCMYTLCLSSTCTCMGVVMCVHFLNIYSPLAGAAFLIHCYFEFPPIFSILFLCFYLEPPLYGRILYPPSFVPTQRYPVLIYVYGGPNSQTVSYRA